MPERNNHARVLVIEDDDGVCHVYDLRYPPRTMNAPEERTDLFTREDVIWVDGVWHPATVRFSA
jgi:hypothetical protein